MNLNNLEQRINSARSAVSEKVANINEAAASIKLADVVGKKRARGLGIAAMRAGLALATLTGVDAVQSQFTNVSGLSAAKAAADGVYVEVEEYLYHADSRRPYGQTFWPATYSIDPTHPEYAKFVALNQSRSEKGMPLFREGEQFCEIELETSQPDSDEKKGHWTHAAFKLEEMPAGVCGPIAPEVREVVRVEEREVVREVPEKGAYCVLNGQPFSGEAEIGDFAKVEIHATRNSLVTFKGGFTTGAPENQGGQVWDVADGRREGALWFINGDMTIYPRVRGNLVCPPGWPDDTIIFNMTESMKTIQNEGRTPVLRFVPNNP